MELNEQNLSELWEAWIGSKDMLIGLKRPVNFLGSIAKHKERFLNFATEWIKDKKRSYSPFEDSQEYHDSLGG